MKKILPILLLFLLIPLSSYGGDTVNPHTGELQKITDIQTEDGTTIIYAPEALKVPNDTLTENADGTASLDFYTKDEVNMIVEGAAFDYFLNNTASDIGTYFVMDPTETGDPESPFSDTITNDAFLIDTFATSTAEPTFTELIIGVYDLHVHADTTTGANVGTARLYWEVYKRTHPGGVETLLVTSEESDILTGTKTSLEIHGTLTTDTDLDSTDRLVLKVYANIETSRPQDPVVTFYAEGTTATHFEVKTTLTAFDDRYINVTGDIGTGVHDYGGATSFEIPNAAAPTVGTEAGEIAVDTTDDQLIYYGGAKRVLRYEEEKAAIYNNLVAADDNVSLGMFSEAVTITGVACSYIGTGSTVATITLEDGDGNAMTITGTNPTCVAHGTDATFAAVTAANTLNAGEIVRMDVTNTPDPVTDDYTIVLRYIVNAQ